MNLTRFQKPSRYIGNEINIIRKEIEKAGDSTPNPVKVALCFPDTYEVGMSHLGLKILYSIINSIPHASAERVFAPWVDFESFLRQKDMPLTSLERNRPLKKFDIIGFTLQYELSYTNVLNIMDLGGLPIRSDERGDNYPLVIAGGPCTVNPLPLVPFIDAFVIGDGEEVIREIIDVCSGHRMGDSGFRDKEALLSDLAKLEGVYVPSVHSIETQKIRRRMINSLEEAPFPDAPVVPFTSVVHDRVAIEISRGCTRGCRFCQAGMIYRPVRERSVETILSIARRSISNTGYEEVSFVSLSTGDYSNLLSLVREFNKMCSDQHIAISLPSLRIGSVSSELLKEIKSVRKTGFTVAPEAGTKRLREVINKDFTDEEYEETLNRLFTEGWRNIKLYFMVGLPTETGTDIEGIIRMVEMASRKGRKLTGRRVNINVGVSSFIPKPHTPFQWLGQMPAEELRARQELLRKAFRRIGANLKGQHIELSLLEAVFSRGDMDCASLLETAWGLGCRFDSWTELFDFDKWLKAAEKTGIDLYQYASRTFDINARLPWEFIDTGITKDFLKAEYHRALRGQTFPDCRDKCYGCGLGCRSGTQGIQEKVTTPILTVQAPSSHITRHPLPTKIRVRYSKTGMMRYLSHHELMTAILRAMRRAELPITYSSGFHPHPRVSFGPALPAGVEGLSEYFDVELSAYMKPYEFLTRLNKELPAGLKAHEAVLIPRDKRSLNDFISRYEYEIIIDRDVYEPLKSFMDLDHYQVSRDGKRVDIRPMVETAEVVNETLRLILVDTGRAKVRLYETLKEMLKRPIEEIQSMPIKRMHLYGQEEETWVEPSKV